MSSDEEILTYVGSETSSEDEISYISTDLISLGESDVDKTEEYDRFVNNLTEDLPPDSKVESYLNDANDDFKSESPTYLSMEDDEDYYDSSFPEIDSIPRLLTHIVAPAILAIGFVALTCFLGRPVKRS